MAPERPGRAASQNSWHQEYYRAECEAGAVAIGRDGVTRIHRHSAGQGMSVEDVAPVRPEYDGHQWLIDEFLSWLDGGRAPDTILEENIKSVAMVFGAIDASRTNQAVDVEAMVNEVAGG